MSKIQPMQDDGQSLPALHGHVIGFVDTREQVDAAVEKLVAAGFSQQEMALLAGEAGISLIKRVDRHYFADTEGSITSRSLAELRKGRFSLAVKVKDGDQANRVALVAKEAGGRGFTHFGIFVNTQFN